MSELQPLSPEILWAAAQADNAADAERQAITNVLFEGWDAAQPRRRAQWEQLVDGGITRRTNRFGLTAEATGTTLAVTLRSVHTVPLSQLGPVTASLNDFHRDGLGIRAHAGMPAGDQAPMAGDWQVPLAAGVTVTQLVEFLRFASAAAEGLADHLDEVLRVLGGDGDTDLDDDLTDSASAALAVADEQWRRRLADLAQRPVPPDPRIRHLAEVVRRRADEFRGGFLSATDLQDRVIEAVVEAYEAQETDAELEEWTPRARLMTIALGVLAARLSLDDEAALRTLASLQRLSDE